MGAHVTLLSGPTVHLLYCGIDTQMTSQNVFIPFNFENAWTFLKIYRIYCNFSLKMVEIFVLTMVDLIGIIFYSS